MDENKDHDFLSGHIKFLGRWISSNLNDEAVKSAFKNTFFEWLKIVDEDQVNGFIKLWIYQHFVLHKASWALMVHDFNHNFISKQIQQPTNVLLRKWAGMTSLSSVTMHFEHVKVIFCHLLKHSADHEIATVYQSRVKGHPLPRDG